MTDRREATPLEVAMTSLAQLDDAAAELVNLRRHLSSAALDAEPGTAFAAARSAAIVAGVAGQVADELRALGARQSMAGSSVV